MLVRGFGAGGMDFSLPFGTRLETSPSGAGGLEELDRVTGGVFEQDLLPTRSTDDVVAEPHAHRTQPLDLGCNVVHDEVDAVPAARFGRGAVGHRPPGRAPGTAE